MKIPAVSKRITLAAAIAIGIGLAGCGSGSTTSAPADSCETRLAPWVDFFKANIASNPQYLLESANSAGLLYGTGGTGGAIGEWLREVAIGTTQTSTQAECATLSGEDLSWIPSPPSN